MSEAKGALFEPDGPFPIRAWATWLAGRWNREKVLQRLATHQEALTSVIPQRGETGNGTERLVRNFAALQFAMEELFEFAGWRRDQAFAALVRVMQRQMGDTQTDRKESVAILDRLAREISITRPDDLPPFRVTGGNLYFPLSAPLDFLTRRGHTFPVKSARQFGRLLRHDGFLVEQNKDMRFGDLRFARCVGLDMERLAEAGIDWPLSYRE